MMIRQLFHVKIFQLKEEKNGLNQSINEDIGKGFNKQTFEVDYDIGF